EFARKGRTRFQPWCKACNRIYLREHYRANKEYHVRRIRARKQQIRDWLRAKKRDLACAHCGENHPACLQFHHLDPSRKEISIAKVIAFGWSISRIEQEIAKCIVL